jgi:hypothetical protein
MVYPAECLLGKPETIVCVQLAEATSVLITPPVLDRRKATRSSTCDQGLNFKIQASSADDDTNLLDASPAPTAKQLYDKVSPEYAGTTYIRKAEVLQRLIYMRPQHEKFAEFLTRAIQLQVCDCLASACSSVRYGMYDAMLH